MFDVINFKQINFPQGYENNAFNFLTEKYKQDEKDMKEKNEMTLCQKQNELKNQVTDLQAFKWKNSVRQTTQYISCFELINLPPQLQNVTIQNLNKIEFPVLACPIHMLQEYALAIINASIERRSIGQLFNLRSLLQNLAENYNINAYHNFSHAFSVLLLLFQSYNRSSVLQNSFSQKHWFYIFIAALAHDLNHPGTINAFEVKRKSAIALEYKNESVLENMHITHLWTLIKRKKEINFLQGLNIIETQEIRKLITRLILATDVSKHFRGLDTLRKILKSHLPIVEETSYLVLEQLFHGCDIGNPCLDFQSYMNWGALVTYQFDHVAKMEKALDLEVTSFMKYEGVSKYYEMQKGFCVNLVLPLWTQICLLLPGLEQLKHNIQQNIKQLDNKKKGNQ